MVYEYLVDRHAHHAEATRPATYRIAVRDFEAHFAIGIYPFEREIRQRLRINVELTVAFPHEGFCDELHQVVSYEEVVECLRRLAAGDHIGLLETLADRIAITCLQDSRVRSVAVSAEKLDFYPDAGAVGVRIERFRPQGAAGDPPV